jgi:hypothetical protein
MSVVRKLSLIVVYFALWLHPLPSKADAIFDFESDAQFTTTPFTNTVNGLSAIFTGPMVENTIGGTASICDTDAFFATLTRNVLIESFCISRQFGPIGIRFSSDVKTLSFAFVIQGRGGSLTLQAFENATPVGTATFLGSLPDGRPNEEGFATFDGTFNSVILVPGNNFRFGIDNVNAATVPEPATLRTIAGTGFLLFWLALRLDNLNSSRKLLLRVLNTVDRSAPAGTLVPGDNHRPTVV